jgi:hypothetical protein
MNRDVLEAMREDLLGTLIDLEAQLDELDDSLDDEYEGNDRNGDLLMQTYTYVDRAVDCINSLLMEQ